MHEGTDRLCEGSVQDRRWRIHFVVSVLKNKVLLFLCVCSILILIDVQKNKEGEKNPMYQNMVNSDFSIALNQTNSSVEFANSILSRDSIYGVRRSQDCRTAPAHRNPPAHRGNHSRSIPYQSRTLDRNSAHSPTASRDN